MANNPHAIDNLIPFKPGQSGNPKGRPPSFRSMFKKLPKDAQAKAADVLWAALQMPNATAAAKFLKDKEVELPECGFMFQVLIRGLLGKDGAWVLGSILDRLFGRPRQQAEVKHTGNTGSVNVVVSNPETAAAVEAILANTRAGAAPVEQSAKPAEKKQAGEGPKKPAKAAKTEKPNATASTLIKRATAKKKGNK